LLKAQLRKGEGKELISKQTISKQTARKEGKLTVGG
jgi:hypothetical protein